MLTASPTVGRLLSAQVADPAEVQVLLELRKHLLAVKRAVEVGSGDPPSMFLTLWVAIAGPSGARADGFPQNCRGGVGCECRVCQGPKN